MLDPEEEYGDMTVPLDADTNQQLELQHGSPDDHDQLPDVEEYKATIGHRSGGTKLKDKFKKAIRSASSSGNNEHDELIVNHSPHDPMERKQDPPEMLPGQPYEQVVENEGLFRIDDLEDDISMGEDNQFTTLEIDDREDDDEDKYEGDANKCIWKSCCMVSLFLIVAVLVQFFVFGFAVGSSEEEPADFFHFVKGNTDEYYAVRDYVVNVAQVSAESSFDQTTTPQYLAAQWMAHGDPMKKTTTKAEGVAPRMKDLEYTERYIMVVLFFAFGGTEWNHQYNFLSGDHICTWFQEFILRDGSSVLYGVHRCKTGDFGELYPHSVFMPNNGLSGFIPDEVAGLERLEVFNIMFNPNIVGTIPSSLQSMDSLTHLALQWCNLDGTIPKWIGDMTSLEYLGLGNNLLDGTVPTEIANLERLELLGLDDNDLLGHIDTFAPLSNLKSLYLENNFFNGSISEELLQGWPKLEELDLSECAFTGVLPPTLFNHNPNLVVLDLHGNEFEGLFPNDIAPNTELDFLAVHANKFDGPVPATLKNLQVLRHLDLSDNLFTATLPEVLGEMTTLEYFFTGGNNFIQAEIPRFLIELTNLKELSMKQNQLEGSIPEFFSYLSNLIFLDLHDNDLNQQIPSGFGKLTALRHLILKQNALSGFLPAEMSRMTSLQVLLMEQNQLEGTADAICSANSMNVETFVADCGDEFTPTPPLPSQGPADDTPDTAAPTTSPIDGIIDDDPSTVAPVPMPVAMPMSPPTPGPTAEWVVGSIGTPSPTAESFAGSIGTPPPSPAPSRFDDDKVFTPEPTTSAPVYSDDIIVEELPDETYGTGPPAGTNAGGLGGFDDLSGNGGDDSGGGRRRMADGQIYCPCCTICCDPGDNNCNNWDWKGNLDPIWEHGYKRQRYSYDLGPVVWLP